VRVQLPAVRQPRRPVRRAGNVIEQIAANVVTDVRCGVAVVAHQVVAVLRQRGGVGRLVQVVRQRVGELRDDAVPVSRAQRRLQSGLTAPPGLRPVSADDCVCTEYSSTESSGSSTPGMLLMPPWLTALMLNHCSLLSVPSICQLNWFDRDPFIDAAPPPSYPQNPGASASLWRNARP